VRAVALGYVAIVACNGIDDVALVFLATDTLGGGDGAVGLLLAAVGIGLLAGYALLARARGRVPMTALLLAGFAVSSAGNLLTGLAWAVAAAFAVQAVRGLGIAAMDVAATTLVQRIVPPQLLGRVFGTLYGGIGVAAAFAYLLGGLLLDRTNPRVAFIAAGSAGLLATAVTAQTLRRSGGGNRRRRTAPGDSGAGGRRAGALAPGGQAGRLGDPPGPGLGASGLDDPFQGGPAHRPGEAVPLLAGARVVIEGGRQVVGHDQVLDRVQHRPRPVPLGLLDQRQPGLGHQALGQQPLDPHLVRPGPAAAPLAGREPQHRPLVVQPGRLAVDPPEAQGLLDRLLVGQPGPARPRTPEHQPDPVAVAVVLGQPGPPLGPGVGVEPVTQRPDRLWNRARRRASQPSEPGWSGVPASAPVGIGSPARNARNSVVGARSASPLASGGGWDRPSVGSIAPPQVAQPPKPTSPGPGVATSPGQWQRRP
jgi:Major Facilitator Superfamily